ncbi:MAG: ATP synthase F0 subunit B [Deltaproteobacteria bacterium]|nr:ATP synthase F0 subunit B [Deltaproteobacteria bacterium]
MRRSLPMSIWCAALAAVPALAAASSAEHGEAGLDWSYFFFHALGLAILLGVIAYFSREPLKAFMLDRSDGIRRQIQDAEAALAAARVETAELNARLARASAEHEEFLRLAGEQAESERALAMERATLAAERIRQEARRAADQEIARARRELQAEAAQLATSLAAEILREGMTPDDDRRLVGEFVQQIERRT